MLTTIPRILRKELELVVWDYVQAEVEGGRIVIRPAEVVAPGERDGQRSGKGRKAACVIFDEIWSKMAEKDPAVIEKTIEEAVAEAGKAGIHISLQGAARVEMPVDGLERYNE